ncbi:MAG: hypothetical protein ACTHJ7_10655 [Candidatus Nitrosocosmicus sp.]
MALSDSQAMLYIYILVPIAASVSENRTICTNITHLFYPLIFMQSSINYLSEIVKSGMVYTQLFRWS